MINKFEGRYAFLSNFYPCEIKHQGIKYPSVEHAYVAMKVNNQQLVDGKSYTPGSYREMIASIPSPGKIKKIGRLSKLRPDWDSKKFEFMNIFLREKFKDEKLKEMLLSTGNEELVEGNYWHDNVYGSCSCDRCGNKGGNFLGKTLMQIRKEALLESVQINVEKI
jgi:ribA/ribD-fused uncharacterized protein